MLAFLFRRIGQSALVMAVMTLGLTKAAQKKVLSYGLIGGFVFRILATLLAVYLIRIVVVKLLGGLYLLFLAYSHFSQKGGAEARRSPPSTVN